MFLTGGLKIKFVKKLLKIRRKLLLDHVFYKDMTFDNEPPKKF